MATRRHDCLEKFEMEQINFKKNWIRLLENEGVMYLFSWL